MKKWSRRKEEGDKKRGGEGQAKIEGGGERSPSSIRLYLLFPSYNTWKLPSANTELLQAHNPIPTYLKAKKLLKSTFTCFVFLNSFGGKIWTDLNSVYSKTWCELTRDYLLCVFYSLWICIHLTAKILICLITRYSLRPSWSCYTTYGVWPY